jgi:hypothetical protein
VSSPLLLLAPLLLLHPAAAFACPVCFSAANSHVLSTYHFTAAMMTLLPLVIVGSIGAWLYLRFRACRPEGREEDREGSGERSVRREPGV